jgi:hypothetical protein
LRFCDDSRGEYSCTAGFLWSVEPFGTELSVSFHRPHYADFRHSERSYNVRLFHNATTTKLAGYHVKRLNIVFVVHEDGHHRIKVHDLAIFFPNRQIWSKVNYTVWEYRHHHLRHRRHPGKTVHQRASFLMTLCHASRYQNRIPLEKRNYWLKNSQTSHPAVPVAPISLFRDQEV